MTRVGVSVVIPTRNRPASLHRTLGALERQRHAPDEVIVVDASDVEQDASALAAAHPELKLAHFRAAPSVCAQRNEGIRRAKSNHVLLLDDDVETPPDCLQRLIAAIEQDPSIGAVTGVWSEPNGAGQFSAAFVVPSFRSLLINFIAQRTVWGDVDASAGNVFTRLPLALLKRWYRYRGNSWSLAGWPLVTQVKAPMVRTAIYTLGSALVRRDWLLASPYDERLGPHGIGDNYGVALGFPGDQPITLLTTLLVRHHKEPDNRLDRVKAYYQRVLALHYFMRRSPRFSLINEAFLVWSLLFNVLEFGARGHGDWCQAALRALWTILSGKNPLFAEVGPARATRPEPTR